MLTIERMLMLTQHDKHLVKSVEKLFELRIIGNFHPLKRVILKKSSMFYSDID